MRGKSAHSSMHEKFEILLKLFSSKRFLLREGIGNELPFYICPFDPKETVEMMDTVDLLKKQLLKQSVGVLEINLYDLVVEILKKEDLWDRLAEFEQESGKDELFEVLQGVLDPEEYLIPEMEQIMGNSTFQILFITGTGEVYPYIRTHAILTNLQRVIKQRPVVLFFPGKYTQSLERGASLNLFGLLPDDKYYRAYNVFHST